MNTWDYIERLRALHNGCSNYRLAKLLDVQQPAMVRYSQGREMDEEVSVRVAGLLGLPPLRVVADIKAARAESEGQTEMANFWRDAARAAGGVVKPLRVAAGGGMPAVAESGSKRRPSRRRRYEWWARTGSNRRPRDYEHIVPCRADAAWRCAGEDLAAHTTPPAPAEPRPKANSSRPAHPLRIRGFFGSPDHGYTPSTPRHCAAFSFCAPVGGRLASMAGRTSAPGG